eukprot:g12629.t1
MAADRADAAPLAAGTMRGEARKQPGQSGLVASEEHATARHRAVLRIDPFRLQNDYVAYSIDILIDPCRDLIRSGGRGSACCSFSGVAGCQHHPDVEAGQDLQVAYMQNAHIASCRGTEFEYDPNCGTYLEVHRPGQKAVLSDVRIDSTTTVTWTDLGAGVEQPYITSAGYQTRFLATHRLCRGEYEVWWVVRTRSGPYAPRRCPGDVRSKRCSSVVHASCLPSPQGPGKGAAEGFRLERFQGSPASLDSADPLLDIGTDAMKGEMVRQKVRKAMLQRMPAPDVIMYFVDMQTIGTAPGDSAVMAQLLLAQMASKLAGLAVACRRAPAPQLWLGTSLAVTLDTGAAVAPPEVKVKLFGWGQAAFTRVEQHQALPPSERRERSNKWREFISSIDKVAWEASRAYLHRFGNHKGWKEVKFVVADFDAISSHDFIGQDGANRPRATHLSQASLHLDESTPLEGEQSLQLVDRSGNPVIGKNGLPATLTCSVRLRGIWQVQIHRAVNLPSRDLSGTSDAWVSLYATGGEASEFCFQQRSSVVPRNLNPEWNESFDLPLAQPGTLLADWLEIAAPSLGDAVIKSDGGGRGVDGRSLVKQHRGDVLQQERGHTHLDVVSVPSVIANDTVPEILGAHGTPNVRPNIAWCRFGREPRGVRRPTPNVPRGAGSGFVSCSTTSKEEKAALGVWCTALAHAADRASRHIGSPTGRPKPVLPVELLVEPVLTAASARPERSNEGWWSAWNPFSWGACG